MYMHINLVGLIILSKKHRLMPPLIGIRTKVAYDAESTDMLFHK